MRVFFSFSDDAGSYKERRTEKFMRAHPYFVRSAVLISAEDWVKLNQRFRNIVQQSRLPPGSELKWSYIGSIMQRRRRGETTPSQKPFAAFSHLSNEELWDYVHACLNMLTTAESCIVIYTVTDNRHLSTGFISELNLHNMHIQDLMQRIELELRDQQGLAIMFSDTMSDERLNRAIRNAYAEFYRNDRFVRKYQCIKDSLAFELSHQSVGIRLADYAAGAFNAFLRGFTPGNEFFCRLIYPKVRKDPDTGNPLGYGIIEVPKREKVRAQLKQLLRQGNLL